jgi:hypothetical protein
MPGVAQLLPFDGQYPMLEDSPTGLGPTGIAPDQLMRAIASGAPGWRSCTDPIGMVAQGNVTTDLALPGRFFSTLPNSGTANMGATQLGWDNQILSTTGVASGNTNDWIGYDGGLAVTNRLFVWTQNLYLPIQVVTSGLYDLWGGWSNKQIAPGTTAPTDGVWWNILSAAGSTIATLALGSNSNNGTAATSGTLLTFNAATSIKIGLVWQAGVAVDLWAALPATPGAFLASDAQSMSFLGSIVFGQTKNATNPLATVLQRPFMAHITRTANTHALNMESFQYGMLTRSLR